MRRAPRRGFTLVELMIALGLGMLVIALTVGLYTRLHRDYDAQTAISETQESLSQVHLLLGRVLRATGGADTSASLQGGRIWLPAGALRTQLDGPPSPGDDDWGGVAETEWGLGFRFVSDNWRGQSDVFDVTYFASGSASEQGAALWEAFRIGEVPAGLDGISLNGLSGSVRQQAQLALGAIKTSLDANAANRGYFLLTNGFHGCVVTLKGSDINLAAPGAATFDSGALSGYCPPFQAALGAVPQNYCGQGGDGEGDATGPEYTNRLCWMVELGHSISGAAASDLGPARFRRYYVCGKAGTQPSVPCMTEIADPSVTYSPELPELHVIAIDGFGTRRDNVVAMGIEDVQVSWKLKDYGISGGGAFGGPCPEVNRVTALVPPAATLDDANNVGTGAYESRLPALAAGGTDEKESGCDNEERWIRRVTLTVLAATDAPFGTSTVGNRAGLWGLNAAWPAGSGGNRLRRTLRLDSYLRSLGE